MTMPRRRVVRYGTTEGVPAKPDRLSEREQTNGKAAVLVDGGEEIQ